MNIYKITQDNYNLYDCYDSHIIVANDIGEVEKIAKDRAADEGEDSWEKYSSIVKLGKYEGGETKPFIVLSSFNAG